MLYCAVTNSKVFFFFPFFIISIDPLNKIGFSCLTIRETQLSQMSDEEKAER